MPCDPVVHDYIRVLGQRVRLHAAADDVHRLCRARDRLELRVRLLELLGELLQRLVAVRRCLDEVLERLREVGVVRRLTLQLLVIRLVAVEVGYMRIGFEGGDQ